MKKRPTPQISGTTETCGLRAAGFAAAFAALTLCAVPAALAGPPAALAPPADRAAATFDDFAASWMQKMRLIEADKLRAPRAGNQPASYKGYGDFSVELRPTGNPRAPYVGILRYEERQYRCADAEARRCGVAQVSPVTELFRYQDGRWVY